MRDLIEHLGQYYATYGYMLVLLGAYFENTAILGLLLPGGSFVVAGAVYAQRGDLWLIGIIAVAFVGMFLGGCTDYFIGRKGLEKLLHKTRWSGWLTKQLEHARAFLDKHGGKAIFFSHFIGHLRAFVALTAGTTHYPFRRFATFEAPAALVWCAIYGGLGYLLGANLDQLDAVISRLGWGAAVLVVGAIIVWQVWQRIIRPKMHPEEA